ncbi:MAG: ribosomal subunit interface protein [Candidatus Harrisonbacteria bacterium CG10_big_fil_rev_8_21_14_0_10_40_38]|uniref:Ribosomal subunit interface protein n=1 Tax=Candidatus Harrisonbacteria bacterium CG10_big_fil_rev_8_21_14_0_10_40_38 TaxID=1974583 RepID=A0A2H0UR44_9BACT|nr:MAG: ribosomal subunit interface protein [Candidatus Harrisonbacteria bacterium CG10_big_fil_rev_8_21_14_0_10_40_38]
MNINIKATNIDLTPALREYVEEKIGSLKKFTSRWDLEGGVSTAVEVGRTTKHHNKGDVYRAEVNIKIPHGFLRAEHEGPDVRLAIDKVRDILQIEIEKQKGKELNR